MQLESSPPPADDHDTATGKPASSGRPSAATDAKKQSMSTCKMTRSPPGPPLGAGSLGAGGRSSRKASYLCFHVPM